MKFGRPGVNIDPGFFYVRFLLLLIRPSVKSKKNMLGSLSINGTLTFKKSYYDVEYYDFDYFLNAQAYKRGNDKLKSKKGKGSRTYKINKEAKRKIENATLLMRHYQVSHNLDQYKIKFLTLTFAEKRESANEDISKFFNHCRIDGIIKYYWWVKEYHPKHYKNYGIKKEHYHCLVLIKKFAKKERVLDLWQQKVGKETFIISLDNIRVRNKYNSFSYQIVMYVSKYCTKGIDKFHNRVYSMSEDLTRTQNLPIIHSNYIDHLLKKISKEQNLTENDIIYYRDYWNQAYIKTKQVETYLKLKKHLENNQEWRALYLTDFEKCIKTLRNQHIIRFLKVKRKNRKILQEEKRVKAKNNYKQLEIQEKYIY